MRFIAPSPDALKPEHSLPGPTQHPVPRAHAAWSLCVADSLPVLLALWFSRELPSLGAEGLGEVEGKTNIPPYKATASCVCSSGTIFHFVLLWRPGPVEAGQAWGVVFIDRMCFSSSVCFSMHGKVGAMKQVSCRGYEKVF